jgi:hypothetical protein
MIDGAALDAAQIVVCNLSDKNGDWAHQPPADKLVGIDPELGRLAFRDVQTQPPRVTFHYAFSADLGGGEYNRADTFDPNLTHVETVSRASGTIQNALNSIIEAVDSKGGAVEIFDSGSYAETPAITLNAGQRLELRAANEHWPRLELGGDLLISGGTQVTINGLLITGGALRVPATADNRLQVLRLCHCTLVPGTNASLIVELPDVEVQIDHCVVGGLRAVEEANVQITDSIVDATSETAIAFAAPTAPTTGGTLPGATLKQIVSSTVIGEIHTQELQLASNSIFMATVRSEKKQDGCVRFCYLPPGSAVSRRYRCQPQNSEDAARLVPQFTSLSYGDPAYAQLSRRCAPEIATGADDESEMGAFHELFQPQRITNLQVRLAEYLRFGLEAGLIYVT